MADPLAASRLPDLPTAGYATRRQRELSDAMMFLLRGLERDRRLLLEVVVQGHVRWRRIFKAAYRAIGADDEFADAVFGYLVLLSGPNPAAQAAILDGLAAQQARTAWDRRDATRRLFEKAQRELRGDIDADWVRTRGRHTVS